jgi:ABC-type phosphate/phosphonate transport system substrate-binding protein
MLMFCVLVLAFAMPMPCIAVSQQSLNQTEINSKLADNALAVQKIAQAANTTANAAWDLLNKADKGVLDRLDTLEYALYYPGTGIVARLEAVEKMVAQIPAILGRLDKLEQIENQSQSQNYGYQGQGGVRLGGNAFYSGYTNPIHYGNGVMAYPYPGIAARVGGT